MTATAIERILESLADAPERFPPALLLTASSEARLEKESRRLAARLLCPLGAAGHARDGERSEPPCSSCRRVEAGLHPDLLSIEPEGVQIRVDRIREALVFAAGRPYESTRRVARILRADLLGIEAGNALLKVLEEPGELVRWILTSTRPESFSRPFDPGAPRRAPGASLAERQRGGESRGFAEEDARARALRAGEGGIQWILSRRSRRTRHEADDPEALEEWLSRRRLVSLLLLAELSGLAPRSGGRLLAELLADAALVSARQSGRPCATMPWPGGSHGSRAA